MDSPGKQTSSFPAALFVGRTAEIDQLRAAVDSARAGTGSLTLVVGDAGVGKTRVASEIAGEASGFDVYWGRCRESEGAPAFWPWIEILRALARRLPADDLRACLGRGAADVAALAPDILEQSGPLPSLPALEGPQARFRAFDHLGAFLRNAAERRPLLLLLDDLHWADRASLLLLRHLAPVLRDTAIALVATYRPVEVRQDRELADALGEIERQGQLLELGGLSRDAVAEFLASVLGSDVGGELASRVHEKTAGNALFVNEVSRLLAQRPGASSDAVTALPLAAGVRHAVRRRLDGLAAPVVEVLRFAAVVGHEIDEHLLGAVWQALSAHVAGHAPADLLDDACRAEIIEPAGEVGKYRFCHPLVRDVLDREVTGSERARVHQTVARALEQWLGDRADTAAGELAHHYVGAASLGDTDKAIEYAKRAGDSYTRQHAYEEAAAQYAAALRVLDIGAPRDDGQSQRTRAVLLLALGRAQALVAYEVGGRDAFTEAAAIARSVGDAELLARAALGMAGLWNIGVGADSDKAQLVEEALRALGEGAHPLRAELLTRSLLPQYYAQNRTLVLERSAEAVRIAEAVCSEATLGRVLGERIMVLYGPDHIGEREQMAQRILTLAEQTDDPSLVVNGHNWCAINMLQRGEVERARMHVDRQEACVEQQRFPFNRWRVGVFRTMFLLLEGALADAEAQALEACQLGQSAQILNAPLMLSIQLYRTRLEQGRLHEMEPAIVEFARSMAHIPAARGPLALAYGHMGRLDECRRVFDAVAAGGFEDYPRDSNWLTGLTDAAHVCWFLDDAERSKRLYEMLLPQRDLVVIGSWFAACSGTVSHYLGLLATVLGLQSEADQHFAAAEESYSRMGARPLRARARLDHAEMILRLDGEQSHAEDLLQASLAELGALDMAPWRKRGEGLLARVGGKRRPPAAARTTGDANVFRADGDFWTISYAGETIRVKDLKGLHYVRTLLREAGREFHVADLAGAGVGRHDSGLSEPNPDAKARAEYRRRVKDLREQLAEAEENNDVGRASRARQELDRLSEELVAAYSPGIAARGRNRVRENIRKAVAKNIRAAVGRIGTAHEALARHLANAIHTGTFCSYRPEKPTDWSVD